MSKAAYDVVVVGAGIVGAACADELVRRGLRTAVVDREVVGGGATAARVPAARRPGGAAGPSHGDIDLQQWAAERTAEAFQLVYNRPVSVTRARD